MSDITKIIIAVNHSKISKIRDTLAIEDTINALGCEFVFRSSDWDNITKTAVFVKGWATPNTPVEDMKCIVLDDTNECLVPMDVLDDRGLFSVGIFGELEDFKIPTNWLYYKVSDGCFIEGGLTFPPNSMPSSAPDAELYSKILLMLNNKSNIDHNHNEIYYTKEEVDENLQNTQESLDIAIEEIRLNTLDGQSAYEIAVSQGFEGSVEEWINSLNGEDGVTPNIQIGEVTTVTSEQNAEVTNTGTLENPIFNFNIPKGQDGESGILSLEEIDEDTVRIFFDNLDLTNPDTERTLVNLIEQVGNLSELNTEIKESIVKSINELNTKLPTKNSDLENDSEFITMADLAQKMPAGFVYGEDFMLYLADADGNPIGDPVEIHGGQSEETDVNFITSSDIIQTIGQGASCVLNFEWSSVKGNTPTGTGSYTVKVNGSSKKTSNVGQGEFSVDVSPYLVAGSNAVAVTVSDMYNTNRTITFGIECIVLTISSTFDNSSPFSNNITFAYTPIGSVTKTVHFYVDGQQIGTQVVTESGWEQIYIIPKQSHGSHSLFVYFTATLEGVSMSSNGLYYEFMSLDTDDNTPIIASDFQSVNGEQYIGLTIPYYVYSPDKLTSSLSIDVDGNIVASYTDVDRTLQSFSYTFEDFGHKEITFTSGETSRTFELDIAETTINVKPVETGKQLFYTVTGRSNLEEHPEIWTDSVSEIEATLDNFNFVSDGWLMDDDGNNILRINNGASVYIPFNIFAEDFRSTGKTIEFEIATRDVMDYDCTIISCMDNGVGFKCTPQLAQFASEQTEIDTPYKEDEQIRVSFVIENRASTSRMICMYVNGILSAAAQYPTDDGFSQVNPVGISIGNPDCTVDIYAIRIYNIALSRQQIVNNWIADTQNGTLKKNRYTRNNIYDPYGKISIAQLPKDLPYMIVETSKLPTAKGDKQSANVIYIDLMDADLSFEATGASIDVQGTSSQGYYKKNFKIKYKSNGFVINGTPSATYALRGSSKNIPVNVFTYKADVASSEGVNNVELVRLYNDFEPYIIPPKVNDSRIRSGIDGLPIVMFYNDGDSTTFYGKMNFNHDKETGDVYGFQEGDLMFSTENNTSLRTLFQSGEGTDEEYLTDFEFVYPDGGGVPIDKLRELVTWVASTYRSPGDTDEVKAQKLQKFKDEIEDYIYLDSALYFYCFTELFLMVDSWAKNCFPKYFASEDKWYFHAYDMDTAIGINNEGKFVYSYGLETDDTQDGADVMNARKSALWNNIRDAFPNEIQAMYQKMRSKGISYEKVIEYFENHQAKWSENIFNEDAYVKYINPLIIGATGGPYLPKLHGSKAEQNRWWLYNRFKYMDSKYIAGDSKADIITIRAYAKDDIEITPYADLYCGCSFGGKVVNIRGERNTTYTLENPLDTVNDTEYFIYSASQLKDVGDLSGHKPGSVDFAPAIKLQSLKIGDGAEDYTNPNLTELTVGNNILLKKIDVRNCPNLSQSIDLSKCIALEEVYFTGTSVKGVQLANGGVVKKLHLPDTLVNLSLLNQTDLEECTVAGGSALTTLRVENTPIIDTKQLCREAAAGTKVRLLNVDWTFEDADEMLDMLDKLDSFRGIDETGLELPNIQITGKFKVPVVTIGLINELNRRYGWITLEYDTCILDLVFLNYDDSVLFETTTTRTMEETGKFEYILENTIKPDDVIDGQRKKYYFDHWDNNINNIETDTTFKAIYRDRNIYTVNFINYDDTILQTYDYVLHGDGVEYTLATPIKPDTEVDGVRTHYEFDHWSINTDEVTEDLNVYAVYREIGIYSVVWLDWNGLEVDRADYVLAGSNISTNNIPIDEKKINIDGVQGVRNYLYQFVNWDIETENVNSNLVVTAIPLITPYWWTTFVNYDGSLLASVEVLNNGITSYPLEDDPYRAPEAPNIWAFSGWDYDLNDPVRMDLTITAQYTSRQPIVTFMNGDTVLQQTSVPYGGSCEYDGETPTTNDSNEIFFGWVNDNHTIQKPVGVTDDLILKAEWHVPIVTYAYGGTIGYLYFDEDAGEVIISTNQNSFGRFNHTNGLTNEFIKLPSYNKDNFKVLRCQEGVAGFNYNELGNGLRPTVGYWEKAIFPSTMTGNLGGYKSTFSQGTPYALAIYTTDLNNFIQYSNYWGGFSDIDNSILYPKGVTPILYLNGIKFDFDIVTEIKIDVEEPANMYLFKNLKKVTIGQNVKNLKSKLFANLTALEEVIFDNDKITTISQYCFYNCPNLKTINIPINITRMEGRPFYNNIALDKIMYEGTVNDWNNIVFSNRSGNSWFGTDKLPQYYGTVYFNGVPEKTIILDNISTFGSGWCGSKQWESVEIISPVISCVSNDGYFEHIFRECSSLKNVNLPDSLNAMGNDMFYNCKSLEYVNIPTSIVKLGTRVFCGCVKLSINVHLPKTLTTIGVKPYEGSLIKATYYEGTPTDWAKIDISAFEGSTGLIKYTPQGFAPLYFNNSLETDIVIDNTVTKIGYNFCGSNQWKSIKYEGVITEIPKSAFQDCTSLEKIDIPNNMITVINAATFMNCKSLVEFIIPNTVKEIGQNAFSNCILFEVLSLPESIIELKSYAFSSCSSIKDLIVNSSSLNIAAYAFYNNGNIKYRFPNATISDNAPSIILLNNSSLGNSNNVEIIFKDQATAEAYKRYTNWSAYAKYITYEGA